MKRILMASDLSARSDRALQRAVSLADELGAELEIVTVSEDKLAETATVEAKPGADEALAKQLAAVAAGARANISQRVIAGVDYEDIIQRSNIILADLVILGTHRRTKRELFREMTAALVLRHGNIPVLVVKNPVIGPYRHVLVPTDLSAHAEAATRISASLAPQGKVSLLHVVHRPFKSFLSRRDQNSLMADNREQANEKLGDLISRLSAELADRAPQFEVNFLEGDILGSINAAVAKLNPDLLAVGTHGRSGFAHAVIGSIAEQLLCDASVDILAAKAWS